MDGYEIEPLQLPERSHPGRTGAKVKVWNAEREGWEERTTSGCHMSLDGHHIGAFAVYCCV